jgi:hypothetical protein
VIELRIKRFDLGCAVVSGKMSLFAISTIGYGLDFRNSHRKRHKVHTRKEQVSDNHPPKSITAAIIFQTTTHSKNLRSRQHADDARHKI